MSVSAVLVLKSCFGRFTFKDYAAGFVKIIIDWKPFVTLKIALPGHIVSVSSEHRAIFIPAVHWS